MTPTDKAAGEAMPKILSLKARYSGSEPVDELDFATDLLRTANLALTADRTSISDRDMEAIASVVSYAVDSLMDIRPILNGLNAAEGRRA